MRNPTLLLLALAGAAGGCANAPSSTAPAVGAQTAFDGWVVSIDTDPWAYDGNAVVVVATDAQQRIGVQLPARWNLCKAPSIDVQALKPGDRVHVVGTVGDADRVTVCERETHRLERVPG